MKVKAKDNIKRYSRKKWKDAPDKFKDIIELAHKMFMFVLNDPDSHGLENFIVETKISLGEIKDLAKKHPYFDKVLSITKSLITGRLKKGWHKNKIDPLYARKYLEVYDEEYRELQLQRVYARSKGESEQQKVDVVKIPGFVDISRKAPSKEQADA